MFPDFEARRSDLPLVERIWRSQSEGAGRFTAISTSCWSMVVSKREGHIAASLHGPKTGAAGMALPPGLEWFGIDFKLGTFMPHLPPGAITDTSITLPQAAGRAFWLDGSAWELPTYENADTFVRRLVRQERLVCDPVVEAVRQGDAQSLSLRMVQYRVRRSTGLSQRTIRQIERARYAAALLKQGVSIFDTVYQAGYSDQPHLTRSLRHFIGQTPAEIPTASIIALLHPV